MFFILFFYTLSVTYTHTRTLILPQFTVTCKRHGGGEVFFLFFFFKLVTWPTGERNYNCINFYYKIFEHIFLILVISQKKKKEKEEEEKRISIITSQMNSLCLVQNYVADLVRKRRCIPQLNTVWFIALTYY